MMLPQVAGDCGINNNKIQELLLKVALERADANLGKRHSAWELSMCRSAIELLHKLPRGKTWYAKNIVPS